MVQIPCSVRKFLGERNYAFLPISLISPSITGHFEMMVDSGSSWTGIAPKDLLRFRKIKMRSLSKQRAPAVGLASHTLKRIEMGEIEIILRQENGDPIRFPSNIFHLFVPTRPKDISNPEVQSIPNLLGIDFLEEHNAFFHFDPRDKIAYIELKDK